MRDNLPRVIVQDSDFPLKLEKVVARSFLQTDLQFAKTCSLQSTMSSGTTALTAMVFGRYLLLCLTIVSQLSTLISLEFRLAGNLSIRTLARQ